MLNIKRKNIAVLISLISCCYSCKNSNDNLKKQITNSQINSLNKKKQSNYTSNSPKDEFTHPIKGKDENGNEVKGTIYLQGEIAEGKIKNDENKEIEIVTENIQSNRIIATDINGFRYRLKIDE